MIPVVCGTLSGPTKFNGQVTQTGIVLGSTAAYTCDTDYSLVGNATRECQADGNWSGAAAICQLLCIILEINLLNE